MNITGIITEYNPFHNGHLYHLNSAKEHTKSDGIVCIMSGNFVQRGGPAILDKWIRTEMALNNGVDLVIELPTYYAVSSAESFASGAVSILNSLGIVNNLYFGSECGHIDTLVNIAKLLCNEDSNFKELLKSNLKSGLSFAKSRENALMEYYNDENIRDVISSSNNILAIEYIKSIISLNSNMLPSTVMRKGSQYNDKDLTSSLSSATAIRKWIKENNLNSTLEASMPKSSLDLLQNAYDNHHNFSFDDGMFQYIKHRIITQTVNYSNLLDMGEGLDKKIEKEILQSSTYEEFILKVKSKRYTYSRISRLLTQIFIGFDTHLTKIQDNLSNEHYCRILGFNKKGQEILALAKKSSTIPLITKVPKHFNNNSLLELDILATRAYSTLNNQVDPRSDYLKGPIILR